MLGQYFRRMGIVCATMLLLSGCKGGNSSEGELSQVPPSSDEYFIDYSYLGQEEWRDNSMDAYSARFISDITPEAAAAGYTYGGHNAVMGKSKVYVLQKHLYLEDYRKAWDELIVADGDGNVTHQRLSLPFTPENNNQIVRMGQVWGSDHLICLNVETDEDGDYWRVFELDEELRPQWDFVADFLRGEVETFPECALMDGEGNVHLDIRPITGGETTHYVVGKDGEVLASLQIKDEVDGAACSNGWMFSEEGELLLKRKTFYEKVVTDEIIRLDFETGSEEVTYRRECENTLAEAGRIDAKFVLQKDGSILYADGNGLWKADASWENAVPLYLWKNHGFSSASVDAVYPREDGTIAILYNEADGDRYAVLTPTTEEVEVRKLVFAVSKTRKNYYQPIADAFNKKYPTLHVELKDDYDETRLLAELGSGKGPVLVDTLLTGFESQKKLWEPLDGMLRATGLEDELFEKAMDLGRIDGMAYGIVLDFTLSTVIVKDRALAEEWEFECFLSAAEDEGLKAIFPATYGNDSRNVLVFSYLMHGTKDNYLLDVSYPEKYFDGERLTRVLNLVDKMGPGGTDQAWKEDFLKGDILCNSITLWSVTQLADLRSSLGMDMYFAGFPTNTGGKNYLTGAIPLAVRVTATDEEKKIAHTFLLEALSHDSQATIDKRNSNFFISVRKDVFEEQVQRDIENYLERAKKQGITDANSIRETLEKDAITFRKMIEEAEASEGYPEGLEDLLYDEFSNYFKGNFTKEALLDHLQNRVKLYYSETEQK